MLSVKEIMTTSVITISEHEMVSSARQIMDEHHFRHIPVVDGDNKLVGVVTQRDLLKAESSSLQASSGEAKQTIEATTRIGEIMSAKIKSVSPEDSLKGAGLIMQNSKIGCLPVEENGCVVGIITDSDFVGAAISLIDELDSFEDVDSES